MKIDTNWINIGPYEEIFYYLTYQDKIKNLEGYIFSPPLRLIGEFIV